MKESVLSMIRKCPVCGVTYLEENGETCRCTAPMFPDEEPRVREFEDVKAERELFSS